MAIKTKSKTKIVTKSGQVSLGSDLAGQEVQVTRKDENTWVIKKGQFIVHEDKAG